jgi:hypothetical protein
LADAKYVLQERVSGLKLIGIQHSLHIQDSVM